MCAVLTWSAVCCHVAVTGAVSVVATVDATVFVIGTSVWPVFRQPQMVEGFSHTKKARPVTGKTTNLSVKSLPPASNIHH